MAKDPAFLFYPGDFNTGTQFFTDEQVGKYIRLLMAQHQHGHLPDNHVLHICKTYDKDVMNKFIKDSEGLWFNERLENEIVKRKEYSLSRSKNRTKPKNISKTYVKHMEDENENKDIVVLNNNTSNDNFEKTWYAAFDEQTLETYKFKYKFLDLHSELEHFKLKCDADPKDYHSRDPSGLRQAFLYQLKNTKPEKKHGIEKIIADTAERDNLIRAKFAAQRAESGNFDN